MHHGVQEKGRFEVFQDYHLRVGESPPTRSIPPAETLQQQRFDATEVGAAKSSAYARAMRPTLADAACDGVHDAELFESITTPGKLLLLVPGAMPRGGGLAAAGARPGIGACA